MDLKRDTVKYLRDIAKSSYQKDTECFICETRDELQFHHFSSLTLLWNKWAKENGIVINSIDDIMVERENFKGIFYRELYTDTVTLCKHCHMVRLHGIYGKSPALATAERQKRWCQRMKDKHTAKRLSGPS